MNEIENMLLGCGCFVRAQRTVPQSCTVKAEPDPRYPDLKNMTVIEVVYACDKHIIKEIIDSRNDMLIKLS